MSRLYCKIENGYIVAIGAGCGGTEITEHRFQELMAIIQAKPQAEESIDYRLKDDCTWEAYERPPIEDDVIDEEATAEDYQTALAEMGVQV